MRIKFLKDHLKHKAGSEIEGHPNANYLITLGVAVDVKEKAEIKEGKEKVEFKPKKEKAAK